MTDPVANEGVETGSVADENGEEEQLQGQNVDDEPDSKTEAVETQTCYICRDTKLVELFYGLGVCFECHNGNRGRFENPWNYRGPRHSDRAWFLPYRRQNQLSASSEAEYSVVAFHSTASPPLDKGLEDELRVAALKSQAIVLKQKIEEATTIEREKNQSIVDCDNLMESLRVEEAELRRRQAELDSQKSDNLMQAATALRRVIWLRERLAEVENEGGIKTTQKSL